MTIMNLTATWNADFIDAQYRLWKKEPDKLSRDWRLFFEGFELAAAGKVPADESAPQDQLAGFSRIQTLIHRYRDIGHLMACLDPLAACPTDHPLLNLEAFNLTNSDLDREVPAGLFPASGQTPLREIIGALRETYCHSIGVEFMHLQDPNERQWLIDRMEPSRNQLQLDPADKRQILEKLIQTALLEQFLNKKYLAVTRFSLEGGDAIIPALRDLVQYVARKGGSRNLSIQVSGRQIERLQI